MKRPLHLFFMLFLAAAFSANAQNGTPERYLDEIFSEVKVTKDVEYGENVSILPIIIGQSSDPLPVKLTMDIYEPVGDTATNRPIVIVAHAGDFLPAGLNLTPYGDKGDSAFVSLAMKMAKRGFVGVSINYRQGWNPTSTIETELRKQVLEASVRCTQDMHNAIRFFYNDVENEGNTYGVDPTKVAIGGEDASTYGVTNVAFLKDLAQASIPKFLDFSTDPPTPFVDSLLFGNITGTKQGLINIPNYPQYPSDVSLIFGLVGGLGEFSWIEEGDPAVVGVQNIHTYEETGIRSETIASGANLRILVDAAFVDTIVARSVELGNNDVFIEAGFDDEITQIAQARSGGLPGMLVLNTPIREGEVQCDTTAGVSADNYGRNGDPWNWYNQDVFQLQLAGFLGYSPTEAAIRNCRYQLGNPNDADLAKTYLDTIAAYLAPRMVVAMGIEGTSVSLPTNAKERLSRDLGLKTFPNPASDHLNISAKKPLRSIQLMDLNGRVLYQVSNIDRKEFQIAGEGYSKGMYLLKMRFDEGELIEKILWK